MERALGRHGKPHVLRGVGVGVLTVAPSCHVLGILDAVVVFGVELNWRHTTIGIANLWSGIIFYLHFILTLSVEHLRNILKRCSISSGVRINEKFQAVQRHSN